MAPFQRALIGAILKSGRNMPDKADTPLTKETRWILDNKLSAPIIEEFEQKSPLYQEFAEVLHKLLKELLDDAGIPVHSITSRSKSKDSFVKKIRNSGSKYGCLRDVTDLCGLRVITHFEDDVARVAQVIESEFQIDVDNSVDKSKTLDPDRFGYLSVHYILTNNALRSELREYRRFNGLKAEVQIRSILQHAWAEIEHDLGYKSRQAIPRELRRRFSRLAGLLELADQEFKTIRDELGAYSENVSERIREEPAAVELNALSFQAVLGANARIKFLDARIAAQGGWKLKDPDIENCAREVERLNYFKIFTVKEFEQSIEKNLNTIEAFAHSWLNRDDVDEDNSDETSTAYRGICSFYLCYLLAARECRPNAPTEYVKHFNIGFNFHGIAMQVAKIFKEVGGDTTQ
jgi:putative GTP pyrophosphokinase